MSVWWKSCTCDLQAFRGFMQVLTPRECAGRTFIPLRMTWLVFPRLLPKLQFALPFFLGCEKTQTQTPAAQTIQAHMRLLYRAHWVKWCCKFLLKSGSSGSPFFVGLARWARQLLTSCCWCCQCAGGHLLRRRAAVAQAGTCCAGGHLLRRRAPVAQAGVYCSGRASLFFRARLFQFVNFVFQGGYALFSAQLAQFHAIKRKACAQKTYQTHRGG